MKLFGLIELTKRLFGAKTTNKGEVEMAKPDVVSAGVAAIQQGEIDLYTAQLGVAYDGGFTDGVASVPPSTGGDPSKIFSQADLDAAVAPLNQQIATLTAQDQSDIAAGQAAVADAQKQGADALAGLQAQFDALSSKEGQEASVIAGLQGALSQMQNVVSILQGLQVPVVPAPAPTPAA